MAGFAGRRGRDCSGSTVGAARRLGCTPTSRIALPLARNTPLRTYEINELWIETRPPAEQEPQKTKTSVRPATSVRESARSSGAAWSRSTALRFLVFLRFLTFGARADEQNTADLNGFPHATRIFAVLAIRVYKTPARLRRTVNQRSTHVRRNGRFRADHISSL